MVSCITNFANRGLMYLTGGTAAPSENKKTKFDDFCQGNKTGSCWFLSAYIACENDPQLKKIVDNDIKTDGKSGYYVNFAGDNSHTTYHIQQNELFSEANLNKFSYGNPEVRAMELAANKYFNTVNLYSTLVNKTSSFDGSGGTADDAMRLFTNKTAKYIPASKALRNKKEFCIAKSGEEWNPVKDELSNLNKNGYLAEENDGKIALVGGIDSNILPFNNPYNLLENHSYAITKIKDGKVSIVDPHYSGYEQTITLEEAGHYFTHLSEM